MVFKTLGVGPGSKNHEFSSRGNLTRPWTTNDNGEKIESATRKTIGRTCFGQLSREHAAIGVVRGEQRHSRSCGGGDRHSIFRCSVRQTSITTYRFCLRTRFTSSHATKGCATVYHYNGQSVFNLIFFLFIFDHFPDKMIRYCFGFRHLRPRVYCRSPRHRRRVLFTNRPSTTQHDTSMYINRNI